MRKLLIISTTFFPDPTVPAIRMTQWCRHLPALGWQPHVICRHYGYERDAAEFAERVHPQVTVEYLDRLPGAGTFDRRWPVRWRQFLLSMFQSPLGLAGLFVPDPSIRFWRSQRRRLLQRVLDLQPDVILTSSPPHSIHDLGRWLAAQTAIPWVADFRDPYLIDNRFRPSGLGLLRYAAHRRFKEDIYRRAWLITHAIPNQARHSRRRMAFARDRIQTLTNAFPLEIIEARRTGKAGAGQTVLVTGTIPEPAQLRLASAVAELVAGGADVRLKLLGKRPDCEPKLRVLLGGRLVMPGYVSHQESITAVAEADVLVNFLDAFRSESRLVSTKLYEYLASGHPILCINPSQGDRLLLWRRSGVRVLKFPTPAELVAGLREALSGKLRRDPVEVERFRREFNWPARAAQLSALLDRLVAFPPRELPARSPAAAPRASVVIPTRNRKDLLRQAIRSSLAQSVPVEVIVLDDGSTDGTPEMVRAEFPQVRCFELGKGMGPSFQRNRGVELARAEIVFPIDDDSVFSTARVVEQTLAEFDHPRVAAVGIPFLNPRSDWRELQRSPEAAGCFVAHAFVGAAHAVRRSVFLAAGGFREHFFYMGEEGDLCLRLLNAGYITRLGRSDPIHHLESPRRNSALANRCGRRNDILFGWHNVPSLMLLPHLTVTAFNGFLSGIGVGHPIRMISASIEGVIEAFRRRGERKPVSAEVYWLHRRLKKEGARPLREIEARLPTLPEETGRRES